MKRKWWAKKQEGGVSTEISVTAFACDIAHCLSHSPKLNSAVTIRQRNGLLHFFAFSVIHDCDIRSVLLWQPLFRLSLNKVETNGKFIRVNCEDNHTQTINYLTYLFNIPRFKISCHTLRVLISLQLYGIVCFGQNPHSFTFDHFFL